jgi:hypothetical protein
MTSGFVTPQGAIAIGLPQGSIAAASVTSSYQLVGVIFGSPVLQLWIYNSMDQDVQISWDGVNDRLVLPSGGTYITDAHANCFILPGNQGVYIKTLTASPTTGSLYCGGFTY